MNPLALVLPYKLTTQALVTAAWKPQPKTDKPSRAKSFAGMISC